jgi:hypothetical protein
MAKKNAEKTAARNLEATRKQAAEQSADAVEANSGLSAPSGAALDKAQQEGVAEAVKESAKDTYKALTDGNLPGEPREVTNAGPGYTNDVHPITEL